MRKYASVSKKKRLLPFVSGENIKRFFEVGNTTVVLKL